MIRILRTAAVPAAKVKAINARDAINWAVDVRVETLLRVVANASRLLPTASSTIAARKSGRRHTSERHTASIPIRVAAAKSANIAVNKSPGGLPSQARVSMRDRWLTVVTDRLGNGHAEMNGMDGTKWRSVR